MLEVEGRLDSPAVQHAGGMMFGIYKTFSDGTTQLRYFHLDAQNSVVAVTDDTGTAVENLSYEPFGKRRSVTGMWDPNNTITGATDQHGYTLEEMLDDVEAINLNGRMYAPGIARFMSADPTVQSPYSMQSYNRYSYAWNNPMVGFDPSGYSWITDKLGNAGDAIGGIFHAAQDAWKSVWHSDLGRTAITIATAYYTGGLVSGSAWASCTASGAAWGGITAGASGGFAAGVVGSGGNFDAGLQGAASGALFGWAGGMGDPTSIERYSAHAFAGCLSGEIGNGGCGNGAFSAVAGKWATNATNGNFVASVVAGGTVSVIGGGKFANGAETAAFGYLYNYCFHDGRCFTTAAERALLRSGNYSAYYKSACAGNDSYTCQAGDIAAGQSLPAIATTLRLGFIADDLGVPLTESDLQEIRLKLAVGYANYLGDSPDTAKVPSAQAIAEIHWAVFGSYGLPEAAFGGTPFGRGTGVWFTKQYPAILGGGLGWCPRCAP